MPIELDDRGLRIYGHNVKGIQFYDPGRALQQEIYLRSDDELNISVAGDGAGGAADGGLSDPTYLVLSAHDGLSQERVFNPGSGLAISDDGAGNNYNVAVSLATGLTFSGIEIALDWSDTPTTIEPDDAANAGASVYAAKGDHVHAIVAAVPGSISPDDSATEGTATSFARSDHIHGITCDVPVAVDLAANAEGSASYFSRSDHKHDLSEGIAPTWTGAHTFQQTVTARSIMPELTDAYDLGSETKLWRKGYLSELEALVFVETSISLIGGWLVIPHGQGTLPADLASGADTCDFGQAMTVGDFVEIRAFLQVEYFEVGALVAGTTYKIGLDGSGARNLDGSGANNWPAGTAYLILGQDGDGRISFYGGDPSIKMIVQGATYNSNTTPVVFDSNGILIAGGAVVLGANGLILEAGAGSTNAVRWVDETEGIIGSISANLVAGDGITYITARNPALTTDYAEVRITAIGWNDMSTARLVMHGDDTDANTYAAIDFSTTEIVRWALEGTSFYAVGGPAGDVRIGGGLYVGSTATDPDTDDIHYDGNLKSVKGGSTYDAYAFVPLTTPLTSTDWDGDAKAADADGIIDLSAVFGAPAGIKAALCRMTIRDETANVAATLGPNVTENNALIVRTQVANQTNDGLGLIPCDANGDIYFLIGDELDAVTIEIWGYCI